jgi:hypothetical protein
MHVRLKPNDATKRLHIDTKNGNFEGEKRWMKSEAAGGELGKWRLLTDRETSAVGFWLVPR